MGFFLQNDDMRLHLREQRELLAVSVNVKRGQIYYRYIDMWYNDIFYLPADELLLLFKKFYLSFLKLFIIFLLSLFNF